jgi:hypothetical protein
MAQKVPEKGESMKKRRKPFANIVLDIVAKHPEAAEKYALLRFYYLREHCGLAWLNQETYKALMKGLKHLSSVERAYRKLKELGLIQISEQEQARREALEAEIAYEMVQWR